MSTTELSPAATALADRVTASLGDPARLGVAFSGGVDSSVLLALATRALGPGRTLAILGVSASLAAAERRAAHAVAAGIGAPLIELTTNELTGPNTGPTAPTVAFTVRPNCSNASTTSWSRPTA